MVQHFTGAFALYVAANKNFRGKKRLLVLALETLARGGSVVAHAFITEMFAARCVPDLEQNKW
ncbi:MAG: hypothetical protein OXE98_10090 [Hyphomicrobiales bacterium]|nr:hypothetical protein [Hyphomicrobiales bacterium]